MIRSEWDAWLGALAGEGKFAPTASVPLAMRGYEWSMEIALEGDYTGSQLIGRVSIAPDSMTNLAVMVPFGPVLFEGRSLWKLTIPGSGANSTASMPINSDGERVDRYPFLLTLVPPDGGPPSPLLGGLFTLLGAI